MGREATVFELEKLTYTNLKSAIMRKNNKNKIAYTIEFYPEEGKYHYTGHRNCSISYSPEETKKNGIACLKCGKNLTVGVMARIEDLANKNELFIEKIGKSGVKWIMDPAKNHPPYVKLVPLNEIIAQVLGMGVASMKVKNIYEEMIHSFGSEFEILLKTPLENIQKHFSEEVADAILKVRSGDIYIKPGFDGEYGVVKISENEKSKKEKSLSQAALF